MSLRLIQGQTERQCETSHGIELTEERAMSPRQTPDLVKQQARGDSFSLARDDLCKPAHFKIPMRPAHDLELAAFLPLVQPLSKISIGRKSFLAQVHLHPPEKWFSLIKGDNAYRGIEKRLACFPASGPAQAEDRALSSPP